jgi:hypothetical protein
MGGGTLNTNNGDEFGSLRRFIFKSLEWFKLNEGDRANASGFDLESSNRTLFVKA